MQSMKWGFRVSLVKRAARAAYHGKINQAKKILQWIYEECGTKRVYDQNRREEEYTDVIQVENSGVTNISLLTVSIE